MQGSEARGSLEQPVAQAAAVTPEGSGHVFGALRHGNYRLLVAGQFASSTAQWMEQVARGWLIYEMTDSAFLLGLVSAVRALPLLFFGLIGGVLADRLDRKRQLMTSQLLNMALNVCLATLVVTGLVQTWHVFLTAFLAGCVMAFQQPARQSLIPNTVPRVDLVNALALNSGILNLTRSIGPAVAGVLVSIIGVGGSYYFQAALFMGASLWTAQLSIDDKGRQCRQRESIWSGLLEGLNYVRNNQTVFVLLALSLLPVVLAQPYSSLIPVFARDVYHVGPTGLGIFLGATGAGAIVGALQVAALGDFRWKGWYMLGVVMAFGLSLVGFALTPWPWLAVALLGVAGFSQTSYRIVNQSLLHTNTIDEFRGRVMSVYLLDRGLAPLGSLLAGTLASFMGAPAAVSVLGAATFLVAVVVAASVPQVRRMS